MLSVIGVTLAGNTRHPLDRVMHSHPRPKGAAQADGASNRERRRQQWSSRGAGGDEVGTPWVVDAVIKPLKMISWNMRTNGDSRKGKKEDHMWAKGELIAHRLEEEEVDIAMV